MNNGPETGAAESHWEIIHDSPGNPDIWQLHYAANNDSRHNAPKAFIANPGRETRGANWILLIAWPDSAFTIRNSRTGGEKRYPVRP